MLPSVGSASKGLICFCGINYCIAFKRVVFKLVHFVFTEVCSVARFACN